MVPELRIAVIVVIAATVIGLGTVARLHWRAFRLVPGSASLTPLHVALVSSGVLLWGVALTWGQLEALNMPATVGAVWRMGLYLIGGAVILVSLIVIGGLQRRKVRIRKPVQRVFVEEVEQVSVAETNPTGLRAVKPRKK